MTRPIRYTPYPNALFEITLRTLHGRLLLTPSKDLNEIILGILGRALSLYPEIKLHCFVFVSNHYHALISTPDSRLLALFMNHVNANLAKEAGRLHQWRERFWSRRYRAIAVLDEAVMMQRLRYLLEHGCKEGLISSPDQWPGVQCVKALTSGQVLEGFWFDRTQEYRARRKGKTFQKYEFATRYQVPLSPLPGWENLPEAERRAKVQQLVDEIAAETRARLEQSHIDALGAKRVLDQDPHSCPRQVSKSPAPTCHTVSRKLRDGFRDLYRAFLAKFQEACEQLKSGQQQVSFPRGSYPPALSFVSFSEVERKEYAPGSGCPFPLSVGLVAG